MALNIGLRRMNGFPQIRRRRKPLKNWRGFENIPFCIVGSMKYTCGAWRLTLTASADLRQAPLAKPLFRIFQNL
jgi:hypothetical protein